MRQHENIGWGVALATSNLISTSIIIIIKLLFIVPGYLEQGLMVKDPKMLRKHYLKSVSWRYDLISLLPTDIAYYWWIPGSCDDVSILYLFIFYKNVPQMRRQV